MVAQSRSNLSLSVHKGVKFVKRTWRFWLALWVGKASGLALKILGKQGTTFPGVIAQRIYPKILGQLAWQYPEGVIIVTGTNGKTTTANLLASILKVAGKKFAFNQAGANLVTGITGALLQDATWVGSPRTKLALLEVDEATVPKLCQEVVPKAAIVTNFFRDQLDRYGELDTTVRFVKKALPEETQLILNADDPLVAQFGTGRELSSYYGIDRTPESVSQSTETREAKFCPHCGAPLAYTLFHYGQLGNFACPGCGFKRPLTDVLAEDIRQVDGKITFKVGQKRYAISLLGYFNLYNALAAVTAAKYMKISDAVIEQGLAGYVANAGRMEQFALADGEATLALIKNPTGFNQVIQTILGLQTPVRLLIAINDLAADGRDISWLWDVDFEKLGQKKHFVRQIVCSGLRAEDMALRLKYAGIPEENLVIEHSLEQAINLVQTERSEEAVFVLPTYTALFPMRGILEARQKAGSEVVNSRKQQGEASA